MTGTVCTILPFPYTPSRVSNSRPAVYSLWLSLPSHLYQILPEMESLQGERSVSTPVCARKQTNAPTVIEQGISTGSCNRQHAPYRQLQLPPCTVRQSSAPTHLSLHVPPFLLAQNLSSKRITPTDNMRPKSNDTKSCHRLLKGSATLSGF